MSVLRLLLLVALPLLAATCQPSGQPALPPTLKELQGTWLHSREEDHGDTMVYRPNTYSFPPSRGRTGFAIGPFGRFTQYDIAPTDGLAGQPGTWTLLDGNRLLIQPNDPKTPAYELQVLRLEGKKMYVRRSEPVVVK
jgi:hypothetical protein